VLTPQDYRRPFLAWSNFAFKHGSHSNLQDDIVNIMEAPIDGLRAHKNMWMSFTCSNGCLYVLDFFNDIIREEEYA
jgi:hypothetical protein